jgi:hypothetical protein
MKIYFAGSGHNIEKTPFIDQMKNCNFLLSYGGLNQARFLWIIGKKTNLPQNIIDILIKNYENIPCYMVGRAESSKSIK